MAITYLSRFAVQENQTTSVFSRAAQDALVAGLKTAIVKVYPATGHALHWERPEEFARDLDDFVASAA